MRPELALEERREEADALTANLAFPCARAVLSLPRPDSGVSPSGRRVAVIAGVGSRGYYRRLGYALDPRPGLFMMKESSSSSRHFMMKESSSSSRHFMMKESSSRHFMMNGE